jgi:cytosine/adenosine deaminase-related metal-dependent hydrolase
MLVRGKYALTRAEPGGRSRLLTDAAVVVRDGTIVDAGPYTELRDRHTVDSEIGTGRQFLMPGLINAHHHGFGVTMIQLGVLDCCLEVHVHRLKARRLLEPYTMALYTIMQHVRTGTTTVMLKHGFTAAAKARYEMDETLRAFRDAGMRIAYSMNHMNQCYLVNGSDAEFLASLPGELAAETAEIIKSFVMPYEEYEGICTELAERFPPRPDSLVRVLVSPQNYHWCDEETLGRLKQLATRLGLGIHTNLAETVYQRLYAERRFGDTPTARLYKLGFLGPEVSLAHGTWLTREDMDLVATSGAGVCHNASSNLRLASGIAPVLEMLRHNIPVGICTDSQGINDDEDMYTEMRLVSKLQRPPGIESEPITAEQVLHMATASGAHLTTFGDLIGALEPGRRADMVLLDWDRITHPFVDDEVDPLEVLLYRARGSDVDTTIIDGRVVYHEGRFLTVDAGAVTREVCRQLQGPLTEDRRRRRRLVAQLEPHLKRFYGGWRGETTPYYPYHSAS